MNNPNTPITKWTKVYYSILGYVAYVEANPKIWVTASTPVLAIRKLYRVLTILGGWGNMFCDDEVKRQKRDEF